MGMSDPGICRTLTQRVQSAPGHRHGGFTLLEILVALAILGIFSLLSYQGLARMLDGSAALKSSLQGQEVLDAAFRWLEESCSRALYLRLPSAAPELQYRGDGDPPGFLAEIVRPVADPALPPQRLLLELKNGRLTALIVTVGRKADGPAVLLLENVAQATLSALDQDMRPLATWPPQGSPRQLPRAIEFSLTMADGRRFRRVFAPR